MAVATPDWLKQREGELQSSTDGMSAAVYFAGQLQYVLVAVPARGKFACRISETINGCRLDGEAVYASREESLRGGLDVLRGRLGW